MVGARHSLLRSELLRAINRVAEPHRIACAFPRLDCRVGDRSVTPDIVVLRWESLAIDECGELVDDDIGFAPDWIVEINSQERDPKTLTENVLHCLDCGCELGWIVDLSDRSIVVLRPQHQPECIRQDETVRVLDGINLTLSANQIFDLLKMQSAR